MQLGLRFTDPRRSTALVAAGLVCLLIGSEAFFRYAELPLAKLLSTGSMMVGVLAFGIAEWSVRPLAMRGAAAVVYGIYLAQACWRFSGLIKDARPYAATDVAWLVLRVEAIFALLVLATAIVTGYWQSRRARDKE